MIKKNKKTIAIPVVNESFPAEFGYNSAGSSNSPGRPGKISLPNRDIYFLPEEAMEDIVKDIEHTKSLNGVVCISAYVLNNFRILDALEGANVMAVVQKDSFKVAILERYVNFRCLYPRSAFPGDIIPHLERRDGQNDFGLIEGVRLFGNYYPTPRLRKNENRPLGHDKLLVCLIPDVRTSKLAAKISWAGGMNLSNNAEVSFEFITRDYNSIIPEIAYQAIANTFSHSEGLYNFAYGVQHTYEWKKKPVKFPVAPPCTKCGGKQIVPVWISYIKPSISVRQLKCLDCGDESRRFLAEHVALR